MGDAAADRRARARDLYADDGAVGDRPSLVGAATHAGGRIARRGGGILRRPRLAADIGPHGRLCGPCARSGDAGDCGAGRRARSGAYHPHRCRQLHRLRCPRHRSDPRAATWARRGGRTRVDRLHGLLCRGHRVAHRAAYRPIGAGGGRAGGERRTVDAAPQPRRRARAAARDASVQRWRRGGDRFGGDKRSRTRRRPQPGARR